MGADGSWACGGALPSAASGPLLTPCLLTLPFSGWGWAHVLIAFSMFFVCIIGPNYYFHFANGEVEAHEVPMSCSPSREGVETGNTDAFCMLPLESLVTHLVTPVPLSMLLTRISHGTPRSYFRLFPCCLLGPLIAHLVIPVPLSMLPTRISHFTWLGTFSVLVKL